jgi:hypothetical protein
MNFTVTNNRTMHLKLGGAYSFQGCSAQDLDSRITNQMRTPVVENTLDESFGKKPLLSTAAAQAAINTAATRLTKKARIVLTSQSTASFYHEGAGPGSRARQLPWLLGRRCTAADPALLHLFL